MNGFELGAMVAVFAAGVICGIWSTGILPAPVLGITAVVLVWLGMTIISLCVASERMDGEGE